MNSSNDKSQLLKINGRLVLVMLEVWLLLISCGEKKHTPPARTDNGDLASADSTSKTLGSPADSTRLPYYVDEILDNLAEGRIAFNAPDSAVELDQTFTIQLLLDPAKTVEDLESMIRAAGPTEGYQIKISENMQARLTGSGFEITAITPEEQLISAKETTEWKWEAKAVEPGSQRLYLTLNAIIKFQGETKTRAIRTFERQMLVKVSLRKRVLTFLGNNWQWLWTALVVPVMGWWWRRKSAQQRARR